MEYCTVCAFGPCPAAFRDYSHSSPDQFDKVKVPPPCLAGSKACDRAALPHRLMLHRVFVQLCKESDPSTLPKLWPAERVSVQKCSEIFTVGQPWSVSWRYCMACCRFGGLINHDDVCEASIVWILTGDYYPNAGKSFPCIMQTSTCSSKHFYLIG